MAKTRRAYPPEFRRQMVELVGAGRTPEELAREFEPTAQSIRNWAVQSERNAGRGDDRSLVVHARDKRLMRTATSLLESPPMGRVAPAPCGARFGRQRSATHHGTEQRSKNPHLRGSWMVEEIGQE